MQGWEELMLVVESSMAGGRKEVALAAIAVITTVMQAHGTTKAVSRRYCHPRYHSEKTRKDYACRRQFNEKPSNIPSCPGAHYPSHVSCKPMAPPRQSHAGFAMLSTNRMCHASPRQHQRHSLRQVLPASLSFACVLRAHSTGLEVI